MSEYSYEDELRRAPRNLNLRKWSNYLNRNLKRKELKMFHNVRYELHINKMMEELHERCETKELFIPALTGLYGNCMFESLNYHGICDDVDSLRKILSYFLYQFQDHKDLFPGQNTSLKEIFSWANEVEYVKCHTDGKIYKYSYNVMCQDLADDRSWTKIPTQIVLMVVSLLFHVEIIISNNQSDYQNIINVWDNGSDEDKAKIRTIWIGHLGESHYVPLDSIHAVDKVEPVLYNEALSIFSHWARQQAYYVFKHNKAIIEHRRMIAESKRLRNRRKGRGRGGARNRIVKPIHHNSFQALQNSDIDMPESGSDAEEPKGNSSDEGFVDASQMF